MKSKIIHGSMGRQIKLVETEEGHFYRVDGFDSLMPSVTTILSQIHKPYLERWKERNPNWRTITGEALRIGTEVHKVVEGYIKRDIAQIAKNFTTDVALPFENFVTWQKKFNVKFISSEIMLWSVL